MCDTKIIFAIMQWPSTWLMWACGIQPSQMPSSLFLAHFYLEHSADYCFHFSLRVQRASFKWVNRSTEGSVTIQKHDYLHLREREKQRDFHFSQVPKKIPSLPIHLPSSTRHLCVSDEPTSNSLRLVSSEHTRLESREPSYGQVPFC